MNEKSRINKDVAKLMMSEFPVKLVNDNVQEFQVLLHGPKDSLYEGGAWKVRVELPDAYPYKSPSIGFVNKIYHPNIDEHSGSVCLDVINQTWSPMFSVINIFDSFLPQLLIYPNPADPLNGNASNLFHNDKDQYEETVKVYVNKFAAANIIANEFGSSSNSTEGCDDDDNNTDDELLMDKAQEGNDDEDDDDEMSDIEAEIIQTIQAKRRQSSVNSASKLHFNEHIEKFYDKNEFNDQEIEEEDQYDDEFYGDYDDDDDDDDNDL